MTEWAQSGVPGWQRYLLEVVHGRPGVGPGLVRAGLGVGALLYRTSLEGYLLCCRAGLLPVARAGVPVLAVGNITVGGTGKTCAVMAIARQLQAAGLRPAILSRGYGGRQAGIVSDGETMLMEAGGSGDEPWLLAQTLAEVPVLVGKNRRETAAMAVEQLAAGSLVLDDGFQYWRLHKDVEVVLVDALNPFDNERVLPAGLLREPIGHLHRADAVWVTHADMVSQADRQAIVDRVRAVQPAAEVSMACHYPVRLYDRARTDEVAMERLRGARVLALSSIGNPGSFERTLEGLGAVVTAARFPDHHAYRPADLAAAATRAAGMDVIVTTEKDAVRLGEWRPERPLWVLGVEIRALDGTPLTLSDRIMERLRT